MGSLSELYQDLILDHSKRPRNRRELPAPCHHADGHNPLCGDRVRVGLRIDDGKVADCAFTGVGCAICTASTSLMTDAIKGLTPTEAEALSERFLAMLMDPTPTAEDLGKLSALAGVRDYPVRVKCATLPWRTMRAALAQSDATVSTE